MTAWLAMTVARVASTTIGNASHDEYSRKKGLVMLPGAESSIAP